MVIIKDYIDFIRFLAFNKNLPLTQKMITVFVDVLTNQIYKSMHTSGY